MKTLPTYEELRKRGGLIGYGQSLHCWHEDYLWQGQEYRILGVLSEDETITITELDKTVYPWDKK